MESCPTCKKLRQELREAKHKYRKYMEDALDGHQSDMRNVRFLEKQNARLERELKDAKRI